MLKAVTFMLLATAAVALAGCHRDYEYSVPALPPQAAATITGSKLSNSDMLKADTRAYLVAIDGKLTLDGPLGWDDRTVVSPGPHEIKFGVGSPAAWGFAQVTSVVEAGKLYVIRATAMQPVAPNCAMSSAWLESEDGTVVTDKVPVMIGAYTGAEVPVGGGGFVSIPSHTVCPSKP
jgi:hypothetical protein